MPGRRAGIVLLVALATAGCGSGGGDQNAGLSSGQSQALLAQLETARTSAASHDVASAKAALHRFTASVARLRRSGALSNDSAHTMRVAAARILKRIQTDNPAPAAPVQPTPSTTSTPTPAPAPPPAPKKPAHGKPPKHEDKGHGKGHGKEGGD